MFSRNIVTPFSPTKCALFAFFVPLAWTTAAWSQNVELRATRPPHFVGEPALIQIVVTGFDEEPTPDCRLESDVDGVQLDFAGVSPQVSESIVSINGRVRRTVNVVFRFNYYASAERAGEFSVGPFIVKQKERQLKTDTITLNFKEIDTDSSMKIYLVLPRKPVYPGQRVPIEIQWWYADDLSTARNLQIRSPLFDQFAFVDEPADSGAIALPIQTDQGQLSLKATATQKQDSDGNTYTVFAAQRMLIADQPGEYPFPPITALLHKVVRWKRDFFGGRQPADMHPVRAVGEPITLTVRTFPSTERPDSFAGAVGPGFALEVSANRTVVRVGDPITLTLNLRGSGNVETAALPPLATKGGLAADQFRIPDEDVPGVYENGIKTFQVKNIRVLDPSVFELPAIAFSWFDPESQSYKTTYSKPIALRVEDAKVVSSGDVFRAATPDSQTTAAPEATLTENGSPADSPAIQNQPAADPLGGADLAIEHDPQVVLGDSRNRFGGVRGQVGIYIFGMVVLGWAVLNRRIKDRDPRLLHRRKVLREYRRQISRAANLPGGNGAEQIAVALRGMVAEAPHIRRSEVQAVLSECESLIYSPGGEEANQVNASLVSRAAAVAEAIVKEVE